MKKASLQKWVFLFNQEILIGLYRNEADQISPSPLEITKAMR